MDQNQQPGTWDRFQRYMRDSATVKLFVIGFIIILLLLPLSFVQSLVNERQSRQREAVFEISQTWGHQQTLAGPVITVPYFESVRLANGDRQPAVERSYAHFLPEKLDITSNVVTEKRRRGIFEVVIYTTDITMSGTFINPDMSDIQAVDTALWNESFISLGISDLHNIGDLLVLNWNDNQIPLSPGVEHAEIISSGVSSPLSISPADDGKSFNYSITFSLRGSQGIRFLPFGRETNVTMTGNWGSPSYQGAFFPTHTFDKDHFSANWKIIFLNRNYPQAFSGTPDSVAESAFGMDLYVPVTDYQKNERSAKYAVLIIALTFMVFFFVQVLNTVRVHGIQFILVGLALCLFYVLLLSFTEHIGFNWAYIISMIMTIGLVSLYVSAIFKNRKLSMMNSLFLVLVYGFVFVIIQMEEYALLVGSIGLFIVLAAAMYLSRNITWSNGLSGRE